MHKLLSLFALLLFFSLSARGQYVVQGRVVDELTDKPLEFVSVYVNTTTIGTSTDEAGTFSLKLPAGRYELIVSYLGYEPIIYQVNTAALPKSIVFKVRPKVNALQEVVVKGTHDSQWYADLEVFKQKFLGQSEFGRQCKLLNPEVLTIMFNHETALRSSAPSAFPEQAPLKPLIRNNSDPSVSASLPEILFAVPPAPNDHK